MDEEFERALGELHLIGRLGEQAIWSLELAGGEPQRIGVARGLLCRPDGLFLDETTAQARYAQIQKRPPKPTRISVAHRRRVTPPPRLKRFQTAWCPLPKPASSRSARREQAREWRLTRPGWIGPSG